LGVIYGMVQNQARLWAFIYDFRLFGYLCIAILPMILLLRRVKTGKTLSGAL
jgi:DHA2 family multidrug resistance protein